MGSDFLNQNSIEIIQKYRIITLNFEILITPSKLKNFHSLALHVANGHYFNMKLY